jgi:cytoskeletal protein RodZ
MKNHEEDFDELHMENADADLISAYNSAIEVPDMWDKISAGFDAELKKSSADKAKRKKSSFYKKWMGLAAAVLLICIIAIPLIKNGLMRNNRTSNDAVEEIAMDNSFEESEWSDDAAADESYDSDAADSYDNDAALSESYASDSASYDGAAVTNQEYENAVTAGESQDDVELSAADQSCDSDETAGNSYDSENELNDSDDAYTVKVSGSIYRQDGEYILTVTAVEENTNQDCTLAENDRILLVNAGEKVNLAEGEARKYDVIGLADLELLDDKSDAAPEYQAQLVTLN